jgi:hypothetical protein
MQHGSPIRQANEKNKAHCIRSLPLQQNSSALAGQAPKRFQQQKAIETASRLRASLSRAWVGGRIEVE